MNDNCLRGIHCPHCESDGPFEISVRCRAIVGDAGVQSTSNYEWDDDDLCSCEACHHAGLVMDFRFQDPARPWDELEIDEETRDIAGQGPVEFRLIFHTDGEPYRSELYCADSLSTIDDAAMDVCRRFGWDHERPGTAPKEDV
jgi:hypothetical protein